MDRLNFGPRLSLHEDEEEALKSNRILTALLEQESEETASLGIEEVRTHAVFHAATQFTFINISQSDVSRLP